MLEKDESSTERLVHVIARLEREMESVAIDMYDNPGVASATSSEPNLFSRPETGSSAQVASSSASSDPEAKSSVTPPANAKKSEVTLSEVQHRIVRSLNTLPGLKKELAFIHPVLNSHGIIISRDVKRFPIHRQGEGVIRHWADHFIM